MQFIDGIRWIIDRRGNQRRSDKIIRQGRISKHLATSKFVFEAKRMITLISNCRYTDMRDDKLKRAVGGFLKDKVLSTENDIERFYSPWKLIK